MNEGVMAAVVAVGGWIFSVEKRLAKLESMRESLEELKDDMREVRDHLLGARDDRPRRPQR